MAVLAWSVFIKERTSRWTVPSEFNAGPLWVMSKWQLPFWTYGRRLQNWSKHTNKTKIINKAWKRTWRARAENEMDSWEEQHI